MTVEAPSVATIKPIAELFTNCTAFWATTFNLDLGLFNEYLLGRLGDPPLNAVILADRDRLDAALESLPPERLDVLGPVNRRWLLRGVRIGTGRFHPKSYLTVTQRTAKLLVGSGNLNSDGIDGGREVFTAFVAGTPHGDAAIRTWTSWMRRLVNSVDDTLLAERFADLQERLPKGVGLREEIESSIWHNLDQPLAEQFCEAVLAERTVVEELIVTAPFYDEPGEALGRLIDRLHPRRVSVYLTSSTKVDGARLAERLRAAPAEVDARAYVPDRFTHAKLVGVVAGDRGWILSGSANLSHAALWLAGGPGNVELAVFAPLAPGEVRGAFLPSDVTAEERPLAALSELSFDRDAGGNVVRPVRLVRAAVLADRRVRIATDPVPEADWCLADHEAHHPLVVDASGATTVGPLSGALVHMVDSDGAVLSNRIVVDDPDALARVLEAGPTTSRSRPAELTATDLDSPLGQALLYLHRNVVMDVSERAGPGGGAQASTTEAAGEAAEDNDLWDRLEREKLGRDPRASTYTRLFGARPSDSSQSEPLVELLEAMRDRAPSSGEGQAVSFLRSLIPRSGAGSRWSATAKIRVRARNVLRRWAAAQTDPRLAWVDPLAPLGNLGLVAGVICFLWRHNADPDNVPELPDDDLDDLWARWFRPFVGSENADGWLDRVELTESHVRAHLEGDFTRNVTALSWLAIRPGGDRRSRVVAWQPYLRSAFDKGIIDVDTDVVAYLSVVAGENLSSDGVIGDLLDALEFIDDDLWCEQAVATLGFTDVRLEATERGQDVSVRLKVGGVEHPLFDSRIPRLIVAVRRYRSASAVALFGSDLSWRIAVTPDDQVTYLANVEADEFESVPSPRTAVGAIAMSQGVLADMFPPDARVA